MATERKRNRQSTFAYENANWGLPKTERLDHPNEPAGSPGGPVEAMRNAER